jgi:CRISPR-associated protein Cas1
MMETLRPVADALILTNLGTLPEEEPFGLGKTWKAKILTLPALDVAIDNERSPLMVAAQRTANSLHRCLAGETRKLALPMPLF